MSENSAQSAFHRVGFGVATGDTADKQMPLRFFDSHASCEERQFGAVYLPFTVNFHGTGGIIYQREALAGERITPPNPPERTGFEFIGWTVTEDGEALYDFECGINGELSLYAYYELLSPSFSLLPLEFYFDGEEHRIEISNLSHPLINEATVNYSWFYEGEELLCTESSLPIKYVAESGDYQCKITLVCGYDSVSVISKPTAVKIKRARVNVPIIENKEYNGKYQSPEIYSTSIYEVSASGGRASGSYPVTVTLCDGENYEFPNGTSSVVIDFEIKPRPITIKLSDSYKYLFSSPTTPTYTVVDGEVIKGDELNLAFIFEGGKVSCRGENKNYSLTVIEGRILARATLREEDLFFAFVGFLVLSTFALVIFVLVWRRREIRHYFSMIRSKLAPMSNFEAQSVENNLPAATSAEAEKALSDKGMGVDAVRADKLISNSMAKSLLRKGREVIETEGNKKSIVNVDTLCAGFASGDTVDVNKLKNMNLVPYDTAYIKVLARGIIDKPLKVYANDFSLSAVRMLALTGGEAVRVVTVSKKAPKTHARRQKNKKRLEK